MLFYLFHPGSSILCSQSVPSSLGSCHDYNLVLFHRNNDISTAEPQLVAQNGAGVETRRARDREVLPRQHPITGKGNLLSSSGEETIRRWVGATFSGWHLGGHFATRKNGSVAHPAV